MLSGDATVGPFPAFARSRVRCRVVRRLQGTLEGLVDRSDVLSYVNRLRLPGIG